MSWIVGLDTKRDFVRWTSDVKARREFTILPDGCRDIVITLAGRHSGVVLTTWDLRPRRITLMPGDQMVGFRLRPGLLVDPRELAGVQTVADAQSLIAYAEDGDIGDVIDRLACSNDPLPQIARQCGVRLRSLQRYFKANGQPSPTFWRMLGRARRAALALVGEQSLVDIGGVFGYADQAHMTRAFRHWFHATPAQMRADLDLLDAINQPALGTWTGEQISIR